MCCAPNVYMFVYTLIGAHIVPLIKIFLEKKDLAERAQVIKLDSYSNTV